MLDLLHLFVLFLLVLLGFYVFVANPRNRAHQTFATFIAFLALWTTKDLIFWSFIRNQSAVGWWVSASFVTALLLQYSLVVFAWVFPENARTPRRRAAVVFAPGLVLIPAAFTGFLWSGLSIGTEGLSIRLSAIAYVYVTYVYFLFFFGAAILFGKYRRFRGTQQGQQVGAILWGLAITGVLKTLANIVLPYFGVYDLLPFSSIFVLPGVLIYAYAILNFRLFSLQTALHQFRLFPITYKIALSIATVAVSSFAIFQIPIVWWAFRNGMDFDSWRKYLVFSIISALVPNLLLVLLVLRVISRPLQKVTLAAVRVREGAYGTQVDLRRSNDEIGLLADSFNEMSRKMATDIEQLKRLNEQLIRAEKLAAMGTLAAGLAHEVNNPLASISSLIQMLRSSEELAPDAREKLELIWTQIQRISQVTKDMTDFARVRSAAKAVVDVNRIVRASLRLASFDTAFQKLTIDAKLAAGPQHVNADADQLQQVFLNLFLNARDAMPEGGKFVVSTKMAGSNIIVEVSDDGCGIDENAVKHIFDPFYSTKPAGKGTGLGLAVCYGIVTAHGGRIEAYQNQPSGTTFAIRLPAAYSNGYGDTK